MNIHNNNNNNNGNNYNDIVPQTVTDKLFEQMALMWTQMVPPPPVQQRIKKDYHNNHNHGASNRRHILNNKNKNSISSNNTTSVYHHQSNTNTPSLHEIVGNKTTLMAELLNNNYTSSTTTFITTNNNQPQKQQQQPQHQYDHKKKQQERITFCKWSELANVAWSYATYGWSRSPASEKVFYLIANETVRRLQVLGGEKEEEEQIKQSYGTDIPWWIVDQPANRDLSQLIWSLGIAQSDNFRLVDSLIHVVQHMWRREQQQQKKKKKRRQIFSKSGGGGGVGDGLTKTTITSSRLFEDWSCADLVQVASALAHARLDEQNVLRALFEESIRRLPGRLDGNSTKNENYDDNNNNSNDHDGNKDSMVDPPRRRYPQRSRDQKIYLFWEITILLWAQARLHLTKDQDPIYECFAEQAVMSIQQASNAAAAAAATTTTCTLEGHNDNHKSLRTIGLDAQSTANLAWSLVVLEQYRSKYAIQLLDSIFEQSAMECNELGYMQLEHAHQMWQALFLLQHESPLAIANAPLWFQEYLLSKWNKEKARPKLSSARHKAISQALTQMGVAHWNEHDEDIDVAIILKPNAMWTHQATTTTTTTSTMAESKLNNNNSDDDETQSVYNDDDDKMIRVAVEFDGPNHFTRPPPAATFLATTTNNNNHNNNNQNNDDDDDDTISFSSSVSTPLVPRPLGHSVLKYRLLKKQGWTVIRVPYYEFDKIPFWASMERQRYLQRLLKTHSTLNFSDKDISKYQPHIISNRKSRFD